MGGSFCLLRRLLSSIPPCWSWVLDAPSFEPTRCRSGKGAGERYRRASLGRSIRSHDRQVFRQGPGDIRRGRQVTRCALASPTKGGGGKRGERGKRGGWCLRKQWFCASRFEECRLCVWYISSNSCAKEEE